MMSERTKTMSERSDLDALEEALAALPPPMFGWTDELYDLYERSEHEPDLPLTDEQKERFAGKRRRQELSSVAHKLMRSLELQAEDGGLESAAVGDEAAWLAERCVRAGFEAHSAVSLLHALGVPVGEQALRRLVRDESVDAYDRAWAREWLIRLRWEGYGARALEPADGEEPLLPPAVRDMPDSWRSGFDWSHRVEVNQQNADRARALLEALLPAERLTWPEPPPEWEPNDEEDEDAVEDERPEWIEIRSLLQQLMPYPRLVTRERMAELQRECELLGLDASSEDFIERWTLRIRAWIAGGAFDWVGRYAHGQLADDITPWVMDLAELYAQRDAAANKAVEVLSFMDDEPRSREVLTRLAANESLRPEIRTLAANALDC